MIVLAVLTVGMLVAGLVGPAAGEPAPVIPHTVADEIHGLESRRGASHVSRPAAAPIPFSMVGFSAPEGVDVEFRTSVDGKTWGPWTEAEGDADEGPDPGTAEAKGANEVLTDPVWVGEAAHIQTRLDGPKAAARPERIEVHLVDSAGLGRSWGRRVIDRLRAAWHGRPPAAEAMPGRPPIVTRSQWGADERLRRGNPYYADRIQFGVVHHTAGSNRYSRSEAPAVMRGIYRYHTQSRGWSDIGYNFLIDRYGTIYEGRAGGMKRPVVGAHAGGFNTGSFGVSLMGTFDSVNPPNAMRQALEQLLAWKYDIHHVDVAGRTTYTSYGSSRYAAGTKVTIDNLSGHKDVSSTACPGAKLYPLLPSLRSRVVDLQGPVLLNHRVSPKRVEVVNGASVGGAVTMSARLRPAGAWNLQVTGPDGAVVHTAVGNGTSASSQWTPAGAERGRYRFRFNGPGRRAARGTVDLVAPKISASTSRKVVKLNKAGGMKKPVKFSGELYPDARWRLTVADPGGTPVHTATGRGATLSATWQSNVAAPGHYQWTVTADDVEPVTGTVWLFVNRVTRTATNPDGVRAAAVLSRKTFGDLGATRVVLTRSDLPAFALPAGPLAGRHGPVLYTGPSTIPSATLDEIRRVLRPGGTVYVMGNGKIVSAAALRALGSSYTVERVGTASPYRTAAAAADIVVAQNGRREALVVGNSTGRAWRQGVAASSYGAARGAPVLLTRRSKLPKATRRALNRNAVSTVWVVGNGKTVSKAVRRRLDAKRIGAGKPARTAAAVSRRLFGRRTGAGGQEFLFANVARRDGWLRALAAAPRAARDSAPLLATVRKRVPARTARYLDRLDYEPGRMGSGVVLGNTDHARARTKNILSRHLQ